MSWASDDYPWWFWILVIVSWTGLMISKIWKYIVAAVVGGSLVWLLL